ncbi:DUF6214 family protein [Streptomyces atriruber]|uniref:DUF6214 family protein n=1 Tax=Streptomyces atriruber TaxID=545121 RepID=UPI000AABAA27
MRNRSFADVSDHYRPDVAAPDGLARLDEPTWPEPPGPSFRVRLTFSDGADVDVTAVVSHGRVAIEDLHAQPPLSPDDFAALVDWIERPLEEDGPVAAEPARRARPAWPRGNAGRRIVAEAYRTAQHEGHDPVLAVMCATGHSRRKSLRLIAGARDAGLLTPRHHRR